MGLLDHKISEIASKIMEHIDLEEVTRDVLGKLVVTDLELYFVVRNIPGSKTYEFLGMTYNHDTALSLREKQDAKSETSVLRLDMGKLMALIEQLGGVEKII